MLKKVLTAIAITTSALAASPAAADPANDLLEIGRVIGVVPYGCRYGSELYRASCLARIAERTVQESNRRERSQAQANVERMIGIQNASTALSKACDAGDRWSCNRAAQLRSQVNSRSVEVTKALGQACRSGDYASCRRLRQ